MAKTQGNLSINSENIFPIIKKWLYSDHDIFFRELISNGCDAITKLKKLDMMGEYTLPADYRAKITVTVDPEHKTLIFDDNGIGMTAAEVEEYINQIAFSGAADFLEKYKDKTNDDQIIGHFGLGFYSAFMVAGEVHIDSLSWQEGAQAVHWECDGGTEFTMEEAAADSGRTTVGTTITLFLNDDCLEFCNEYKAKEVIKKYCSFMPTEIFLTKLNSTDTQTIKADEKLDSDQVIEEIQPEKEEDLLQYKIAKRPELLNETNPLWMRHPNECTKEDYLTFYRTVFQDYKEPLFWIHLNMDYPFNLKGILYFPKINMEYESIDGVIKLYNNQVFIADNIKEVIPEFLLLLKGVIDCPDLPLNVSRSALQNDGFVKKIADYISKKVADKLSGMCKTEKEEYEKYWDDISPFIKYGCLRDDKFCEKMTDYILFKNLDGQYLTLPECLEVNKIDPDEADGNEADSIKADGTEADSIKADGTKEDGTEADSAKADGTKADGTEADSAKADGTEADAAKADADNEAATKADTAKDDDNQDVSADDAGTAGGSAEKVVEAEIVDDEGNPIEDRPFDEDDEDMADEADAAAAKVIYYVTDEILQSQYINMFKAAKMEAVLLTHNIDQPFVSQLESKNEGIKFQRIDADLTDSFKARTSKKAEKEMAEQAEEIAKIMKKVLKKDQIIVKVEKLKNKKISSVITLSEESRRMQDMMKMYSMPGMDMGMYGKEGETLTLNANHPLVQKVLDNKDGAHVGMICEQLYDLALLQHAPLEAEAMSKFVARSNDIMMLLAK